MGANLSGNDIANGDFMIKTCAADPEAGYAKEKFHADPKNGVIISEVDGAKGKRLEFSADWSVVSLDTKLKEGENIEISEDQQTGKVEISAPDVGKVLVNSNDTTLKYLDEAITSSDNSIQHETSNNLENLTVPNLGKVKVDDEDQTFGYLDNKIDGSFPIKKAYLAGNNKKIYIESAEKIAFAPNEIRKADWEEYAFGWNTEAHTVAEISTNNATVNGVNFVVKRANPSTIYIQYQNLSGSAQTLTLYAIQYPTGGSWSQALTFDVELLVTPSDSVYTAEVEVEGLGNYPIAFLLASSDEVVNIFIYNIYKD